MDLPQLIMADVVTMFQTLDCNDSSLEAKIVYGYYIFLFYFSLGLSVFVRLPSHNCSHLGMDH